MPLRFRSVVPYTLPGVIGIIGWWWYISRKKEQLFRCDTKDGNATTPGLEESQAVAGNGVSEKETASPQNGTEMATHRHYKVTNLIDEKEISSNIQVQNTEAAPVLEQSSNQAVLSLSTFVDDKVKPACLSTTDDEDKTNESLSQLKEPQLENHPVNDGMELVMPCRSTEITWSTPANAHLPDVERPEPEGEVAKHHSINAQNGMVVSSVPPPELQNLVLLEADYLEIPPSLQDFYSDIVTSTTSTPTAFAQTSTALNMVQNTITTSTTPEGIQMHGSSREEQDLELLAAGIITEVISAATQEVLGLTSCQVIDGNRPSCNNSTILCHSRTCSQEGPITAIQNHPNKVKNVSILCHESTEAQVPKKEGEQTYNGCLLDPVCDPVEDSQKDNQKNLSQSGPWISSPNQTVNGDDVPVLACSTHHSKDYSSSSEDFQSSVFENPIDVVQVKDVEQPHSLLEATKEASALTLTSEESVDDICEIKRLNGIELRNGARGTYEVDVDNSGGSDVNSMDSVDSGCTLGASESPSSRSASLNCELLVWEIEVPKHLVGRLIGKQGRYVSFLKQTSGAKIYISTLPYTQEFQICHIEGTQQDIDKALSLIGKKFKDLDLTNVYAPQPLPLTLPSLPMTSWLLLPSGVTVEVVVVNIVSAGHIFVQQHTHPTYHALRSLDQQMFLCYSQAGTPALPSPAEVGVICAAPSGGEGAWWRAQVIAYYKETTEVEIRYVDYGGYDRVKIDSLRQIRSDFVTLPFQGAEVLLDNIAPLPGEDNFSEEATSALEEMTRGVSLLAQVSNYDNNTGLPLIHLWKMVGDEAISVNRTLADKGLGSWVDGF